MTSQNTSRDMEERVLDFYLATQKKPISLKKNEGFINIQKNFSVSKGSYLTRLHPKMKSALKSTKLKKILM